MKSLVLKLVGAALIASMLSGCIIIDRSGDKFANEQVR